MGSFVAAGYKHTCALGSGGGLWCWGSNHEVSSRGIDGELCGQLGIGDAENQNSPAVVAVGAGTLAFRPFKT
jgi:alpha-tubulin suppressor-like RCC1 family protein